MKEMTMLDLAEIDLGQLGYALEDHGDGMWYLDPRTGELFFVDEFGEPSDGEEEEKDPEERGLVGVDQIPSSESYSDMQDFAARVRDPRARDLLERALAGRGAFRRFKDTLLEFPSLRQAWFAFHDARLTRRAIDWLLYRSLIDQTQGEQALAEHPDPDLPEISGGLDGTQIATVVSHELRSLYGERLVDVLLFGSWARGDAHPESDIDLLVVLDGDIDRSEERGRMDDVLCRHSFANDAVVTAIPVSRSEFEATVRPLILRALAEGRSQTSG